MKSIHVLVGIYSLIFIFVLGIGAYELWFDSEGDFLLNIFAVIILGVILAKHLKFDNVFDKWWEKFANPYEDEEKNE